MNKQKADKILDLWRQCKADSNGWDESGVIKRTDYNLAKEVIYKAFRKRRI